MTNTTEINKIIKYLDTKKTMCAENIWPRLLKIAANVIDSHITSIMNKVIKKFPERAKTENVCSISKIEAKDDLENNLQVSLFTALSEI